MGTGYWHYSTARSFFFVTKERSKNNRLLSSVIPPAKSLTKFVKFNENSEEVSNVCKILAKNIGDACERNFYTRVSQTLFSNRSL